MPYDAVLLVSFGGPESREDVIPFLENVLRGRPVPRERMLEVAEHYYHFGGRSPINEQNRTLIAALKKELEANGPGLPIYWGNRNWHPMLEDTLREMRDAGIKSALALVTSAFSSYSGCRQYRENIAAARQAVGEGAPEIGKLRVFHNHPGFIESVTDCARQALDTLGENAADAEILFTAHSIPASMAAGCNYEKQLQESCRLVVEHLAMTGPSANSHGAAVQAPANWKLLYQSRSGSPSVPWLGPDICEYLNQTGSRAAVVVPIGFISDHMEVLYDLDTEAREVAGKRGIQFARAATVGTHPRFVQMVRELIVERVEDWPVRPTIGTLPANPDVCLVDCCAAPQRPPAPQRPVAPATSTG